MNTKKCSVCLKIKDFSEFYSPESKNQCRSCRKLYFKKYRAKIGKDILDTRNKKSYYKHHEKRLAKEKQYRQQNKDKEKKRRALYNSNNRDKVLKRCAIYRKKNKNKCNLASKKWAKLHPERIKENGKRYYRENYKKVRENNRKWYNNNKKKNCEKRRLRIRSDIGFKLRSNLSRRILLSLSGKNKSSSTIELLGISIEDFKIYLASKFKRGMTFENHGRYGWHLDHIIPCSSFDLSKPEEQKKCFHYTNLQPLWAKDNLRKGDKINYVV